MELHTEQLQICMNSAIAAQLGTPTKNTGLFNWGGSHTAKQRKSLYSGTVAHMKNIT